MESHERTLVDKKKDKSGDPTENVAQQTRYMFVHTCGRSRCRCAGYRRPTLAGTALGTKCRPTHFRTTRATKGHEHTSLGGSNDAESSKGSGWPQSLSRVQRSDDKPRNRVLRLP